MNPSNCTRPNIAYAIGRLNRYIRNPSFEHWNAIERVFKNLSGNIYYGFHYMGFFIWVSLMI